MKSNRAKILWISLGIILAVFGYYAVRASLNIVTLHVRDMDVRQVVRKIEWQTWESILVNRELQGRVTLDVKNAPLEEVLEMMSRQIQAQWGLYYPLYRTKTSLASFKKALSVHAEPEGSGWTNLFARMEDQPNPMATRTPFRAPVTLQFANQELRLAILALERFADVKIIPADGLGGKASLSINRVSMSKAVRKLAKSLHCKWNSYYGIEPMPEPPFDIAGDEGDGLPPGPGGPPPGMPGGGPQGPPGGPPPGMPPPPPPKPLSKEQEQQREADYKSLMAILPPEERNRLEAERKMHDLVEATPAEQRMEVIQKMTTSEKDSSAERVKGLLSTTPEQRVNIRRQQKQGATSSTQSKK